MSRRGDEEYGRGGMSGREAPAQEERGGSGSASGELYGDGTTQPGEQNIPPRPDDDDE